jgi:hypothetical protein
MNKFSIVLPLFGIWFSLLAIMLTLMKGVSVIDAMKVVTP